MDPFRGVEVEMVSQGRTLDLYDDPEADENAVNPDPYSRSLYVEAVTGATFTFRVAIDGHFELYTLDPDDAVRVFVLYDGHKFGTHIDMARSHIEQQIRAGGKALYKFKRFWNYCKTSGQWRFGESVFSALATEETETTNNTPEQIKSLGSIQIEIHRVRRTKRQTPRAPPIPNDEPITTVSEKMIKGKAIANIVKFQNASTAQPPPNNYDIVLLDGEPGKKLCIDIRYRSRQNLQSLGCIPRALTPEPVLREEVRALRERLARLERDGAANVKVEPSTSANGVKRECDEPANEQTRKRPRDSCAEIVDLTGD